MAQPFFGGIHPNDKKAATNKKPIEKLPPPARVVIPMSMHIGAPCQPCVAVGDTVTVGQRVGSRWLLSPPPSTPAYPARWWRWSPDPFQRCAGDERGH